MRRTILTALACLALVVPLGATARAEGLGTFEPGLAVLIDGDGAVSLDDGADIVTNCGEGRSRLVTTVHRDGIVWRVHGVTKACHEYAAGTRKFELRNRLFICEVAFNVEGSTCTAGTGKSGAIVGYAKSVVQFHADGGNFLFEDSCEIPPLTAAAGTAHTCHTGPYTGATGHCYNAWGWGVLVIEGDVAITPASQSPETCVTL